MTSILLHEYVEQVEKLIDANRLVEAVEHCRHILHHYPRHIDTYRVMGKALLEKQDYNAASDLFLRILGADPNDFISHVGLSIVYKEESQYDQALWHLERAYEIQPYNVAIQGELRQLYAVETETRPGIIPLTRGALARLYMKGELYQQAISELRRILAEEPDRMDLHVLLAEALWRDDQRIDAEEVCLNVLEQLPNCIVLNAILAEIWLQTGRIPEAQKYLQRLQGLTWQTQKSLDRESIAGRPFATDGAFTLPVEAPLEFLETGMVVPEAPPAPTDDWVREVTFTDEVAGEDAVDEVVLEPESGMHSYDWLADIGGSEADEQQGSETDWFSQESAKNALNLSTSELNAEWLADLRGEVNEEDESGFQPLDMAEEAPESAAQDDETDWFAGEDELSDELFAELDDTAVTVTEDTAVDSDHDWLSALADDEEPKVKPGSGIQIDATNLMDDKLMAWDQVESDPGVVKEPKTPFWLSEMADDAIEAVQLNPEDALDWLADTDEADETGEADDLEDIDLNRLAEPPFALEEPELEPDDSLDWLSEVPDEPLAGESLLDGLADDDLDSQTIVEEFEEADEGAWGPTAVLDPEEQADLPAILDPTDTDTLGDADDWLAALTEGSIDDDMAWDADLVNDAKDEMLVEASTDELAALSDADDWLQSASEDLEAILQGVTSEDDEFPNLAMPDMEDTESTEIPDWLYTDKLDQSEEAETAMSSENDPQDKPQPEEPEMESPNLADDDELDALDWLNDLTTDDDTDDGSIPQEPPIATEGMPSWLDVPNASSDVDVVDEWDSESANIPDWLQEPVELSDLDDEMVLDESHSSKTSGLTSLLSEIDLVEDEALGLDDMDSLLADWVDEDADGSLTELLGAFGNDEPEDEWADSSDFVDDELVEETAVPSTEDDAEEIGLTGLLSNLSLEDEMPEEAAVAEEDDFLSELLLDADDDDLSDFLLDEEAAVGGEADEALGLDELDLENVSLTAMLSDLPQQPVMPDEGNAFDETEDDWLADLASLTDDEESLEPDEMGEANEALGLTGMLANLWPDEDEMPDAAKLSETPISFADDPDADLSESAIDELGLTELLAGIDVEDDTFDSRPELPEFGEPVEPSLTEILSDMDVLSEEEDVSEPEPISAEDTTWLTQLEADTGSLQEQGDDFDMAEETGLDWLTVPDEVAEAEEMETAVPPTKAEADAPEVVQELDSTPEDWDDAMSWLEELAAQQEDPVQELPSVAENMLDEELDSQDELFVQSSTESGMDWLDDLTEVDLDDEEAESEDAWADMEIEPESMDALELDQADELPAGELGAEPDGDWADEFEAFEPEADNLVLADITGDGELSWLDELATDRLDETAVNESDLGWLDTVVDELNTPDELDLVAEFEAIEETAVTDEATADEEAVELFDEVEELDELPHVTGVTDALKADDGLEEAEADLEEALAWLDELDDSGELVLPDEDAPPTVITPAEAHTLAEDADDDVPDTVVLTPEPDDLALALDRLEQQVLNEGINVPDTAVNPIALSDDELNAALDWIEQAETAVSDPEPEPLDLALADEMSLADDPEAWLEDLLGGDADLDIEMEPPPIKPSEDAVFVTDDSATESEDSGTKTADSLLDDLELEEMPDDPDAAVAWLDQLVSGDEALDIEMEPPPIKPSEDAVFATDDAAVAELEPPAEPEEAFADALANLEDDPEAWLEQMLAGEMDIEMEPPPIKPSEDAMFVTDDAAQAAPEAESEPDAAEDEPNEIEAASDELTDFDFDLASMEEDPEAWLEQMLAGEMDIEMEPPPIKPSEDAMFVTEDAVRSAAEPVEDSEPEAVADDIIAEVPDDPDEAMAWLEQLAARQGADLDELPSVTDPDAEAEMPDWMSADLVELDGDVEPTLFEAEVAEFEDALDELAEAEAAVPLTETGEFADDDVDSELPDWLDSSDNRPVIGETGWLQNLPEVDMDSWLSAEEEATASGPAEEPQLPDTGPLRSKPIADVNQLPEDDLFEPVVEPSSGTYSVDEAKLGVAQKALADGRIQDALAQFKELVTEGSGMMAIIAELEQAAEAHPQVPALFQVLGDAYMRNGQLQKALASYRSALNQM